MCLIIEVHSHCSFSVVYQTFLVTVRMRTHAMDGLTHIGNCRPERCRCRLAEMIRLYRKLPAREIRRCRVEEMTRLYRKLPAREIRRCRLEEMTSLCRRLTEKPPQNPVHHYTSAFSLLLQCSLTNISSTRVWYVCGRTDTPTPHRRKSSGGGRLRPPPGPSR